MKLILIGDEESKRTIYLKKAAENIGVFVQIISWEAVEHIFCLNELKNICTNEKMIIYTSTFQEDKLKYNFFNKKNRISEEKAFQKQKIKSVASNDIELTQNVFCTQELQDIVSNNKCLEETMFCEQDFKCVDFDGKNIFLEGKKISKSVLNNVDLNNHDTSLEQGRVELKELEGAVIKIDPPSYETAQLCQMQELLKGYQNNLRRMMQIPCQFLNTPEVIWKLLDKKVTKLQLQNHKVPVTKMFDEDVWSLEQLLDLMKKKRCYSVFVKPRYFSGAAGVAAFRIHPVNGKMRVYTSCQMDGDCLVNTKKMVVLEDKQQIDSFMWKLLELGCIVERWYPKAEFEGKSYDLRVVYQFGHIAYIVVRQSGGPITNLHLNNHATDIKRLGLSQNKLQEIESVCKQAMEVFPGLNMAGIDIMLEKNTLRPLIIEMNGQGDLIYQDIYGENVIYSEQIEWLRNCKDE